MKLDCCWVNTNDARRRPRSTSRACLFTFDLFGVIFFVLFIDDNIISSIYLLLPTCLLSLLAIVSKTLSLHRHFAGDVGLEDIRDFVLTILAVEHPVCWFKSDTQRMVTVCLSVCVYTSARAFAQCRVASKFVCVCQHFSWSLPHRSGSPFWFFPRIFSSSIWTSIRPTHQFYVYTHTRSCILCDWQVGRCV